MNVHTAEFPAGAIRGQLVGSDASAVGTVYSITLNGSSEPNATGTAVVRLLKSGLVCYRLHAANVTLPTVAAHIHRGGASVNGPVVVPFTAPGADDALAAGSLGHERRRSLGPQGHPDRVADLRGHEVLQEEGRPDVERGPVRVFDEVVRLDGMGEQ